MAESLDANAYITGQGSGDDMDNIEAPAAPEQPQEQQSPAEAPRMYKIGNEEVPEHELVHRATHFNQKITEMGQTNADLKRELEALRGRHQPIEERYNSDPEFRSQFDELWSQEGAGRQNVLSPEYQMLQRQQIELESLKQTQAFNNLRSRGYDVSPENEAAVRNLIATDPRFTDVDVAYRYLFFDKATQTAADKATTRTAEEMAANAQAYTPPASGTTKSPPPKSPDKMTPAEFEDAVIKELNKAGDWS